MRFRDPKQNGDPPPKYDFGGDMFTLCIHTGGSIHRSKDYVGGDVYKFDHVERDLFSIDSLKKLSSYMDDKEIEVLYTKNDEGQFEQINTESEFQKHSGKAVSEGKELEIFIGKELEIFIGKELELFTESEGKRDNDVQGGFDSDISDSSDYFLRNEPVSSVNDFVDKKDNIEEGTGVGEDSSGDDEVVDDGSGDDYLGESEDDFSSADSEDSDYENEGHDFANEGHDFGNEGRESPVYKEITMYQYDSHLELNMIFSNKEEFMDAVHSNAALNKRVIKVTKSDKVRVYAECQGDGCEWKIHANNIPDESTFRITTYYPTHSCPESYHVKSIKPRWLSRKYGDLLKNEPKRTVSALKDALSSELGVHVSKHQAYKCRKLALKDQYGNVVEQYNHLLDYDQEIRITDPGSTVVNVTDQSSGNNRFSPQPLNSYEKMKIIGSPSSNPYRVKRFQVTVKCSRCHQYGHNKRGCKNAKVVNPTEENYLEGVNIREEEERVDQTPGDNSQVIDYEVLPIRTVNSREPSTPPMHDQLMQTQKSEDDHSSKKTGKRYATRSYLASFGSGDDKST